MRTWERPQNIYVHADEDQLKYAAAVLAKEISPSFLPTNLPHQR